MYLFGGSNGLNNNETFFALDLNTLRWEVVKQKAFENNADNLPKSADEHTAVIMEDKMILFGGFVDGERVNTVYSFNFKTSDWKLLNIQGDQPCPRAGHSAMAYSDDESDYMNVFGGKGEENDKKNDLWRLDLKFMKWQLLTDENAPICRSGHCTILYKDYMLVFGGIPEITKELNDLYAFDLKKQKWIVLFEEQGHHTEEIASDYSKKKTMKSTVPETPENGTNLGGTSKFN